MPHMQRGGAIINTSSVAAYQGRPDMIDCASAQAVFSRTQPALTSRLCARFADTASKGALCAHRDAKHSSAHGQQC